MSGIAGIIHFDGRPAELSLLTAMTDFMKHRGPDGIHHWVRGNVALGHCMLQTTPESLEEKQPLANEDESLILVADVRLDNWEELRAELLAKGSRLRTRADAELVLRAYEQWGRDCLAHFDGDFAFVIWDARRQEAFCARDRLGLKPFVYHFDGKSFSFSSETRPVLDLPWVPIEFNDGLAAELLVLECHTEDETFWKGVKKLPQSMQLVVSLGKVRREVYWQLVLKPENLSEHSHIERYRDLLFDAVRRTSRSHLQVAYDVSGGLDSSALYSVGENLLRNGRLQAPSLQGYTLNFEKTDGSLEDYANANLDLPYARAVAEFLQLKLIEVPPTIKNASWYREQIKRDAALPGYPNGIAHMGILGEASKHSRVSICGSTADNYLDLSDEVYFYFLKSGHFFEAVAELTRDITINGYFSSIKKLVRSSIFPILSLDVQNIILEIGRNFALVSSPNRYSWLSSDMQLAMKHRRLDNTRKRSQPRLSASHHRRIFGAELVYGREISDKISSNCAIEVRDPFCNIELIRFVLSLPVNMIQRNHYNKWIHRASLKNLLPENVLRREHKSEFSITFNSINHELADIFKSEISNSKTYSWIDGSHSLDVSAVFDNDFKHISIFQKWDLFGLALLSGLDDEART